ncbi:MAG: hypothetical protein FWH28_07370 [Clostridiales bacterium]|nr:hypothetical protein [Clostridiales bacterium]
MRLHRFRTSGSEGMGHVDHLPVGLQQPPTLWEAKDPTVFVIAFMVTVFN